MKKYILLAFIVCCYGTSVAQQKKVDPITAKGPTAEELYEKAFDYLEGKTVDKEPSKGITILQGLARQNYVPAIRSLSKININGLYECNIDEVNGNYWLKKGAELGDAECQWLLGWDTLYGYHMLQVNTTQGISWLKKAIEQSHPQAIFALGSLYHDGLFVEKDMKKAFELFNKGARLGDSECQYLLGMAYHFGQNGFERNGHQAELWYKKAVEQNHVDATYNLAKLYEEGKLLKRNIHKAINLYIKATELGSIEAPNDLSYSYYVGDGVDVNKEKAFSYCKIAAERGHISAQLQLGYMFATGEGCIIDEVAAKYWWRLVSKNENASEEDREGAKRNLEMLGQ